MRQLMSLVLLFSLLGCSGAGGTDDEVCKPQCEGMECGDDGCGGSCGGCDDGLECTNDSCSKGQCQHVVQDIYCEISGACAPSGTVNPSNPCQSCQPGVAKSGWSLVEDGVECGAGKVCYGGMCCDAQANCVGKECGDDGCGGACGDCPEGGTCEDGVCNVPCDECVEGEIRCAGEAAWHRCEQQEGCWLWTEDAKACPGGEQCVCLTATESEVCTPIAGNECACVPDCEGKNCGGDGCGGSCGKCEGVNVVCEEGSCQCAGSLCGEVCCASYQVCTDDLTCCQTQCGGKECGEDGCGGVCGTCPGGSWVACVLGQCVCQGTVCPKACCASGEVCDAEGNCCVEQCEGKQCGDNGCGGLCGTCSPGALCLDGLCPPPGQDCNDGNAIDWDGCTGYELTEFLVNETTADWQIDPVVASWPDGSFVVVWNSKGQDGDLYGVFARRFGKDGKALGGEFQVNTGTDDHQERPAVAVLAGGGFVVVYESWGLDGSGDGIAGQVYGPDGTKVSAELVVNQVTAADQGNPAVAPLADGGFVVFWDGADMAVDWNGIYGRFFDALGVPEGDQLAVNQTTAGDQNHPAAARLEDGSVVVAWQSDSQDGDGYAVVGRMLGADGQFLSGEAVWNTYAQGDQEAVTLAPLGSGFVVAWQSAGQDNGGLGIVQARFDAAGQLLANPAVVNGLTTGDQRDPAVAGLAGGESAAVWASKNQDGSDYAVVARRFDADGVGQGELVVNTFTTSIQSVPDVAALPDGSFVVVWRGWEQAGEGYDIYAARFDSEDSLLYH